MATLHTFGRPSGLPFSLLSQAIHRLTRAEMEDLAQTLIDCMDRMDPDPDVEWNGDEEDSDGDERGDFAWPEWDRRNQGGKSAGVESPASHLNCGRTEDDEEDDHDEDDDPSGNFLFRC